MTVVRYWIAVACCWAPFLVVVSTVISWRDIVIGEVATQWDGSGVSTVSPTWTALLLPFCGSLICGVLSLVAAFDGGDENRWAYLWCAGIGAMLVVIWVGLMIPNVVQASAPPAPSWILLAPLAILLGFIPWAIAGRPTRTIGAGDPRYPSPHERPETGAQ